MYTVGWRGVLDAGKPLECAEAQKRRVYTLHPWLRGQAVGEAQRLGNFVRPSSASCLSKPAPNSGLT